MGSIIGYLDNLSFDEGVKRLASKSDISPRNIRYFITRQVESLFKDNNIPYLGPIDYFHVPMGGFFFKINTEENGGKLKELVLEKLNLDESLKVESFSDYICLGILIKYYPNDKDCGIRWAHDNVLNFAKHLRSFYEQRLHSGKIGETPYFVVVDEQLPIDENLDSA